MNNAHRAEPLEALRTELYTPVVGDILDQLGFAHQFLPQPIQPMTSAMVVAGYAMPVLTMDVFGRQEQPFGRMTEALDALQTNEVYIAAGASHRSANWGEIMTAAARRCGAVGAVVDGFHRDTPQVLEQAFPVFSRGAWAQDSSIRMKVVDFRCPIEIEGIAIRPGDIIFGDVDGVLIIPRDAIDEAIAKSLEKARAENSVRTAVENGMSVTEAFRTYGVL